MKTVYFLLVFAAIGLLPALASAATLEVNPASGTFVVGSTFTAQVLLDSQKESVNAIDLYVLFPPDKIQVASPADAGNSFIGVWTVAPQYNNQNGTVHLQGGIPGGIVTSRGAVISITFRVKQTGQAAVRIQDSSRVLLNDGKGTDALTNVVNGIYNFILPPPAGPFVSSNTHPNQTQWYSNANAFLVWVKSSLHEQYSYVLNELPLDTPDDIVEGSQTAVVYKNLASGTYYFHIKAKNESGIWGGTSHFALNVDVDPPAEFPLSVEPAPRTTAKNIVIKFVTTDSQSGIDYYNYGIISLKPSKNSENQPLFIEATSPQMANLGLGLYDAVVRAFDKAGNVREKTQRVNIVTPFAFYAGNPGVIAAIVILTALLGYAAWSVRKWHLGIFRRRAEKTLPEETKKQLDELRRYRERYGKILAILFIAGALLSGAPSAKAEETTGQTTELSPPIITTVSRNISNEEIFYAGGRTEAPNIEVIMYLQNIKTGETTSQRVVSGKKGEWFYRASSFLNSGEYLLWAQAKLQDTFSPPTPQIKLTVTPTAIQFGASRLSYEILYFILTVTFGFLAALLLGFTFYYLYHGRKNQRQLKRELREAEEAVRRGFAVLRRDIQLQLETVKKANLDKKISAKEQREEQQKEEQLLKDLTEVEQYIGKEVFDIENYLKI